VAGGTPRVPSASAPAGTPATYEEKRQADAAARRRRRDAEARERRVGELEARIADRERAVKALEAQMTEAGFYDDRARAQAVAAEHQALMWEVGDLMNEWEALQTSDRAE
jgi:uncharacterized coiled-coil protein SlyX